MIRSSSPLLVTLILLPVLLHAQDGRRTGDSPAPPAWNEPTRELGIARRTPQRREAPPKLKLERITSAVPWPRGLVFVDGKLVVLARGRHRRAGGCDPDVEDRAGCLFEVDPSIAEPVVPGGKAGPRVRANARVLAVAEGSPFHVWDRETNPSDDRLMDRPYCTLVYDALSRNFFICGYSGVDLPGARFRKNATDSIHRFDLRDRRWHPVEMHDPTVVPPQDLTRVVPNTYYPHHDPLKNPAPHGWLNGPDGGVVAGRFLYVAGKDNHTLARYDLAPIRNDPSFGWPPSEKVLGRRLRLSMAGEVREVDLFGHSALAVHDGYLYIGYRTSSVVVRVPLDASGDLVKPVTAELIAEFQPYDARTRKSANLIDMRFNSKGELFVSCASKGRVWKIGVPDPGRVFDGNDARAGSPTPNQPYLDLPLLTGNPKARVGNIAFDDRDRLYVCSGNYDSGTRIAGVIYRAVPTSSATASAASVPSRSSK